MNKISMLSRINRPFLYSGTMGGAIGAMGGLVATISYNLIRNIPIKEERQQIVSQFDDRMNTLLRDPEVGEYRNSLDLIRNYDETTETYSRMAQLLTDEEVRQYREASLKFKSDINSINVRLINGGTSPFELIFYVGLCGAVGAAIAAGGLFVIGTRISKQG
jgi:hypothetical protein